MLLAKRTLCEAMQLHVTTHHAPFQVQCYVCVPACVCVCVLYMHVCVRACVRACVCVCADRCHHYIECREGSYQVTLKHMFTT